MPFELARAVTLCKPWGVVDLRPWSEAGHGDAIGEIWYDRREANLSQPPRLLLKLLFTSQPLSVQVHPDDTYAHSIGLPCGKTEAWYIVHAAPDAKVALGLNCRLSARQLREAIDDGSIIDLVAWRPVATGDAIYVPAGTIHAIGAGLVIAEIQQRSDATFRLFDFGRKRELHVENALAVAETGPIEFLGQYKRLSDERTLLASGPHFAFERIDLPPNTAWYLETDQESWLLVLGGGARAGAFELALGTVAFAQSDGVDLQIGGLGLRALIGYAGSDPVARLLQPMKQSPNAHATQPQTARISASFTKAAVSCAAGREGLLQ